jgi:NAD(P)-dependent dehydrogenase (short-subunit alcohol dehydrogenase family)
VIGFDFSGKRVVVAGAGGGMGLAIANALIDAGAAVTLLDIKPEPPDIGQAGGAGSAHYLQGDLTDPDFVATAFAAADPDGQGLHGLVNAVGIWLGDRDVSFQNVDLAVWDRVLQDAYGASKGAIRSFSRSVAIQCAEDGIRSIAILPGHIMTPMQEKLKTDAKARAAITATIPVGRIGETADIAGACLFLLSDAASFITGTELIIDGGMTARP